MKKKLVVLFLVVALLTSIYLTPAIPSAKAAEEEPLIENIIDTVVDTTDWSEFWFLFNAYSMWNLERRTEGGWVSCKSYMQIIIDYPQENKAKITLIFTSVEAGDYRFTFAIDKRVKKYVTKISNWQYELTYDDFTVIFDWSDVKDISGLQLSHGVKNNFFWFRMRRDNVPAGYYFELDPSIIATSTARAIRLSFQRKTFRGDNDYYYVFYSDGVDMKYRYSKTGITGSWSNALTARTGVANGNKFSIATNGTHVAYAGSVMAPSGELRFRLGSLDADGPISWIAAESIVEARVPGQNPTITFDSAGKIWIGGINSNTPYAYGNSATDGTWSNIAGSPFQLNATADTGWRVNVVALTNERIYATFHDDYGRPQGRLFNGTAFEPQEYIGSSTGYATGNSIVSSGDNAYFAFKKYPSSNVSFVTYSGGSWGAETQIVGSNGGNPTLSIDNRTKYIYAFYGNTTTDDIRYVYYDTSSWSSPTIFIDESTDEISSGSALTTFFSVESFRLGMLYSTKTSTPWTVKFKTFYTEDCPTTFVVVDEADDEIPRIFNIVGTMGNGTSIFDVNTNASSMYEVTLAVHDLNISLWWGTHLIYYAGTAATPNSTTSIDTTIQRLDSGSSYLLFSLNNTALPVPSETENYGWEMIDVDATGTIEFKMDNANWKRSYKPAFFVVDTTSYMPGASSWSYSEGIFTFDVPFSIKDLSMLWDEVPVTPPAGGGGGPAGELPYVPPDIIPPLPDVIPPVVPPAVTEPLMTYGIVGLIAIIGAAVGYDQLIKRKSTPRKAFKNRPKSRRVDWKKSSSSKAGGFGKKKKGKRINWKKKKIHD